MDQSQTNLSRRQWLGKISVPAAAVIGANMIGVSASAHSTDTDDERSTAGFKTYNVRDFGAKGDGKTLDTGAIQKAIDACNKDLGGTVLIPAGNFLCGTIELKSKVTLHLSAHGCLLGSPKREDYSAG
jgi:polygalacturonase